MNTNKWNHWVNMDLEKEPLLPDDPPEDDTEHVLSSAFLQNKPLKT